MNNDPVRILSLDGGGIRGLSTLFILKEIMAQVCRENRESQEFPGGIAQLRLPHPCDHFDLICGTSTGGLIALMLGRLRMVGPNHSILNLVRR